MYEELKAATSEELLEAYLLARRGWIKHRPLTEEEMTIQGEKLIRLGFALAGKDGWEQLAPGWLKNYRKTKERQEVIDMPEFKLPPS